MKPLRILWEIRLNLKRLPDLLLLPRSNLLIAIINNV